MSGRPETLRPGLLPSRSFPVALPWEAWGHKDSRAHVYRSRTPRVGRQAGDAAGQRDWAAGESVPERFGAEARPPVPRPVRSGPDSHQGCWRRRRPPSCQDPLGIGPVRLGNVSPGSPHWDPQFGRGTARYQRPRGARKQETAGTPRRHSPP